MPRRLLSNSIMPFFLAWGGLEFDVQRGGGLLRLAMVDQDFALKLPYLDARTTAKAIGSSGRPSARAPTGVTPQFKTMYYRVPGGMRGANYQREGMH